jgi:LysM repeat protein
MRFLLNPGRTLTLLFASLLLACSPSDSSPPSSSLPLTLPASTLLPSPGPLLFPVPTSARLLLITPAAALEQAPQALPSPTPFSYTVKSGDTISQIAERYGLTVDELIAANPGTNTQILSIGQQIQIPARSASQAESGPAPADLLVGPVRCVPSGAGMWCLAAISNPHAELLENITAQISLLASDARRLDGIEATIPLNTLPAGGSLPLAAFFASQPIESFSAHLDISSAFLLTPGDPRYLPARVDNLLSQISADGLSAQVSGRVFLPESTLPAAEIWLAGVAYNQGGEIVGFRRWQSSDPLNAGESQTFSFSVYSLDGLIDRIEVLIEARP